MSYPLELIEGGFVVKTAKEMKDVPEKEDEPDPDAWSTQHGPPSSPRSAKFSDETPNDQSISKAPPPPRIFRDGLVSGNTTAGTTDEEFMTKWVSNHSSASSSISWAEDAVEAEMTKKIFLMWEDIQRVCTGEVELKPDGMPSTLYDECLNWKRAFPVQDLSRFSRFSEEDSTPTPTKEPDGNYFLATAMFPSQSPDSPNPYCLTPIMENHSTVDMWLSDCQSQSVLPGSDYNQMDASIQSFSMLDRPDIEEDISLPSIITAPASKNNFIRNINNPDVVPDPHNFFTSLALENVVDSANRMSSPDSYKCHGDIRVQRPVSSSARGHLITPLPTKDRQLSRSFRETTSHHRHQTNTTYDKEISTTTITNEFEHIMSLNGNRLLLGTTNSRGRHGLPFLPNHIVHNESSNTLDPSGIYGSASGLHGSASGLHGSASGLHGSASGLHGSASDVHGSTSGHLGSAPTPHAKSRGSSFGIRNTPSGYCRSSYGKKLKASAAGSPSGSNARVCGKILENGTASTAGSSRFSSGASSHRAPNWSRHSSVTETYSFQITPDGSSSSNTKIIDNQFLETNTFQSITERTRTSSTSAAESNVKLTRPDFLPTQARDTERHRPHQSRAKPVRPFLYWLLDKVSPS